jgi:hypothetical protein
MHGNRRVFKETSPKPERGQSSPQQLDPSMGADFFQMRFRKSE